MNLVLTFCCRPSGIFIVLQLPDARSPTDADSIRTLSQSTEQDVLILSDSLSCINALENRNLENSVVVEILERLHQQLHVDLIEESHLCGFQSHRHRR
jgi:hypothetical protein